MNLGAVNKIEKDKTEKVMKGEFSCILIFLIKILSKLIL
jgi:hypothetical protein